MHKAIENELEIANLKTLINFYKNKHTIATIWIII